MSPELSEALLRLARFFTHDPDRPCGWLLLIISRDGSRRWCYWRPA